jgi:hypothetical protein
MMRLGHGIVYGLAGVNAYHDLLWGPLLVRYERGPDGVSLFLQWRRETDYLQWFTGVRTHPRRKDDDDGDA